MLFDKPEDVQEDLGGLGQIGGLKPLSPIAGAATAPLSDSRCNFSTYGLNRSSFTGFTKSKRGTGNDAVNILDQSNKRTPITLSTTLPTDADL